MEQNNDYDYCDENDYGNDYDYTYADEKGEQMYLQDDDNEHNYNMNYYARTNSGYKQYQIIPASTLFIELQKNFKMAQEMTALPKGWCLLLLRQFKWDVQIMTQYYNNMQKYQQQIGYKSTYLNPNEINNRGQIIDICDVCCLEGQKMLENICGHTFCVDCWRFHIQAKLKSNQAFLKCMDDSCGTPVLYETIKNFLQLLYPNDKKLLQKYQKILCQLFSSIHRNYQFCTGVDCGNCIKVNNLNLRTVRCSCGKTFCFKCKSDDHSPCTCDQKQRWLDHVLKQQADAKWMSANTKLCPWCKKAVQRSAGCNYMACVCGKSFCYLCQRPWQPDHKDHFKCHIYKKKSNQQENRAKQILEKMSFYIQRYFDNAKIIQQNKKTDTFQIRKIINRGLKIDLFDTQFIDIAYKFSIECCQSLKWIYAYSFYAKWKSDHQKQTFQFSQGQFQFYKVHLLKKLAVDLKKILNKIKGHEQNHTLTQTIRIEEVEQFKTLKKQIINNTASLKIYKQKFIKQIQKRTELQQIEPLQKKKSSSSKKQSKQSKQSAYNSKLLKRHSQKQQSKGLGGKIMGFFTGS